MSRLALGEAAKVAGFAPCVLLELLLLIGLIILDRKPSVTPYRLDPPEYNGFVKFLFIARFGLCRVRRP